VHSIVSDGAALFFQMVLLFGRIANSQAFWQLTRGADKKYYFSR